MEHTLVLIGFAVLIAACGSLVVAMPSSTTTSPPDDGTTTVAKLCKSNGNHNGHDHGTNDTLYPEHANCDDDRPDESTDDSSSMENWSNSTTESSAESRDGVSASNNGRDKSGFVPPGQSADVQEAIALAQAFFDGRSSSEKSASAALTLLLIPALAFFLCGN